MDAIAALEILAPGPLTTVQDLGRPGYGAYGVPVGGALDHLALRVGNLLVGNDEGDAGLEMTFAGIKARALSDFLMAVTGAGLQPSVNNQPVDLWRTHRIRRGDLLSFRTARTGCRGYLALGGGIDVPLVLGSRSTNLSARFGGFGGRAVCRGDVISLNPRSPELDLEGRTLRPEQIPVYGKAWDIRVIPGPQDHHFPEAERNRFFQSEYQVTPQSDRTGIRLAGPALHPKPGLSDSIISEGLVPGSVQVPGDGQPIILLSETVTGGYRKIVTVIGADLPSLGQVRPGDSLRFQPVSLEEAMVALRRMEDILAGLRQTLTAL
jgi:antagonist of KipI